MPTQGFGYVEELFNIFKAIRDTVLDACFQPSAERENRELEGVQNPRVCTSSGAA
jgi:hypothetical protein